MKFKKTLALVVICALAVGLLAFEGGVTSTAKATTKSYNDYLSGLNNNDKAVSVGMLFSSIGLWTGDMSTDAGIKRFANYLASDMNSVTYEGKSIWSKLSDNGMSLDNLVLQIKEYLSYRTTIREFLSIANTIDEAAIKKLDKYHKLALYPEGQKFVGRNVSLALILFGYFKMPVLNYTTKFTVDFSNVEFLENMKSLYTIPDAANVSFVEAAKNLASELNALSKTQINRELPILVLFNIVKAVVTTPTPSPTNSVGTPTPHNTPMPTPRFFVFTAKIETISNHKSISKSDVTALCKSISLLKYEIVKWYGRADRYASDSIYSVVKVTNSISKIIRKTGPIADRDFVRRLLVLIESLRVLPEKCLSATSLISRFDGLIYSLSGLLKNYHGIAMQDKSNINSLKLKLSTIAGLIGKYSARVFVSTSVYLRHYRSLINGTKNVQIASAIALSSQTAKHYSNLFKKVKIDVSKYSSVFNPLKKWCMISMDGMKSLKQIEIVIPVGTSKTINKSTNTYFLISNSYYEYSFMANALSNKMQSTFFLNCSNTKTVFTVSASLVNIDFKSGILSAFYKKIGDRGKPHKSKVLVNKWTTKNKLTYDSVLSKAIISF